MERESEGNCSWPANLGFPNKIAPGENGICILLNRILMVFMIMLSTKVNHLITRRTEALYAQLVILRISKHLRSLICIFISLPSH